MTIDRKAGTRHPKWDFVYPVNYGYVDGIKAPDGENLDAYVLCVFEPLEQFKGTCIAIVRREDDSDDKLIVVPTGRTLSDRTILAQVEFQERYFNSRVIR